MAHQPRGQTPDEEHPLSFSEKCCHCAQQTFESKLNDKSSFLSLWNSNLNIIMYYHATDGANISIPFDVLLNSIKMYLHHQ